MDTIQIYTKASTADTESRPQIAWKDYDLTIEFNDYTNNLVIFKFFDVPFFKFLSSEEPSVSSLSDDCIHEVQNSELLSLLKSCGEIEPDEDFKHWLVGFNEIGSFVEIIFRGFSEE